MMEMMNPHAQRTLCENSGEMLVHEGIGSLTA